ncbi:DUF58 domain-containing protein [Salinarimonas ramus]|uniref:DUF58 domain-containing protein n=1 Tax=Salinarimonas ramus TaxID=690164 RepID=A0A917V478_9HYPH|nr:DUF58 domain-containing protein [Salinarimonas ramus]GGK37376.1 hypothetical protein GCM10011322_25550 [Salinarimonas ramus]
MARVAVHEPEIRSPGRSQTDAALLLANRLPRLVLEARRVSATLAHGIHGRRRAGPGESFWQFRPFHPGEPAARIDWRRSARDDRLYVREREWEAAHSVYVWVDRSASMAYSSDLAQCPKIERALVLGLALADAFVEAGERVGLLGLLPPRASRRIVERFAEAIAADRAGMDDDLPPETPLRTQDEALLVSDFLTPLDELAPRIESLSSGGARGHLVMIADPVEETFPFAGQAVLQDVEGGARLRVGDAAAWGDAYRTRLAEHRGALADLARRRGWTLTLHRTDRPASEAALRVLTLVGASRAGQGLTGAA